MNWGFFIGELFDEIDCLDMQLGMIWDDLCKNFELRMLFDCRIWFLGGIFVKFVWFNRFKLGLLVWIDWLNIYLDSWNLNSMTWVQICENVTIFVDFARCDENFLSLKWWQRVFHVNKIFLLTWIIMDFFVHPVLCYVRFVRC